jgi:hypothetical protein
MPCNPDKMIFVIGLVLFLSNVEHRVQAQTADQVDMLSTYLLTSYKKHILPRANQTDTVTINITLDLNSINSFDMITQKLSVTGVLRLVWVDEFLMWNPGFNGGITELSFEQNKIWKPDIVLKNSFNKLDQLGRPFMYMNVLFHGVVIWQPFEVFQTTCDADITYFPFDRQSCQLVFTSWTFSTSKVIVQQSEEGIVTDVMTTNAEWNIEYTMASDSGIGDHSHLVTFTLIMRRKPLFPILNIILPALMMVSLNMFVMVLPAESGEKVGFAVTIMLALSVFLTIVSESIPSNSVSVSFLSVYLLIAQVISMLVLMFTVKNMQIFHRNSDRFPVTHRYRRFVNATNRLRCQGHKNSKTQTKSTLNQWTSIWRSAIYRIRTY